MLRAGEEPARFFYLYVNQIENLENIKHSVYQCSRRGG